MTLDPFRRRQVPDVAGRFLRERRRHQRQADLMWLGTLAAMFSDHELRLLGDAGYLSQRDCDLLGQAGRGSHFTAHCAKEADEHDSERIPHG